MWVKVENNEVVKRGLPKTGTLSTGETVSNYHLLPEDTLRAEGWLPLEDNPPTVEEGYRAVRAGYEIHEDYVEQLYTVEEILPPKVSQSELEDRELKKATKKYVNEKIKIDEFDPLEYQTLVDEWEVGIDYEVDDIVKYEDVLYKVLQSHTSQSDWTPDVAVSLFAVYTAGISEWVQPTGAHDAYNAGDMVTYDGNTYRSMVDGNVWEPAGDYIDTLWELIE